MLFVLFLQLFDLFREFDEKTVFSKTVTETVTDKKNEPIRASALTGFLYCFSDSLSSSFYTFFAGVGVHSEGDSFIAMP